MKKLSPKEVQRRTVPLKENARFTLLTLYQYLMGIMPKEERKRIHPILRKYPVYSNLLDYVEELMEKYGDATEKLLEMIEPLEKADWQQQLLLAETLAQAEQLPRVVKKESKEVAQSPSLEVVTSAEQSEIGKYRAAIDSFFQTNYKKIYQEALLAVTSKSGTLTEREEVSLYNRAKGQLSQLIPDIRKSKEQYEKNEQLTTTLEKRLLEINKLHFKLKEDTRKIEQTVADTRALQDKINTIYQQLNNSVQEINTTLNDVKDLQEFKNLILPIFEIDENLDSKTQGKAIKGYLKIIEEGSTRLDALYTKLKKLVAKLDSANEQVEEDTTKIHGGRSHTAVSIDRTSRRIIKSVTVGTNP